MGANDYILAIYAVSGALALGCAFLPGAGPVGRVFNLMVGIGLIGWTANVYLRNGWYSTSPIIYALPAISLIYAAVTVTRLVCQDSESLAEPYADPPRDPAPGRRGAGSGRPDRRGPGRPALAGEFNEVPVNEAPPIHDPWQALYASERRENLRDSGGRHRQVPDSPRFDAVAAIDEYSVRHAEYQAMKTTFATVEAEYDAWRARYATNSDQ